MAAINTGNPVGSVFIVNKYDDIDGNDSRASQETPRGRLCFKDTNGRMTLPRTLAEAQRAVFPVDWAKPLNPGPWYDGPGLNGATLYPMNDGSLYNQENDFSLDPDLNFSTPWPAAIKEYDVYPALYGLPVTSGNKVLVYDGGTFTYASGAFVGTIDQYTVGKPVYTSYTSGNEGKLTVSGSAAGNTIVGFVYQKDVFGPNTITVKLKGRNAISG